MKEEECLSANARNDLKKKMHMTDIMRGVFYIEDWKEKQGVVYQNSIGARVQLIRCRNYNKYDTRQFFYGIKNEIVIIDGEPVGIICLDRLTICRFIPGYNCHDWNEISLCELFNQESNRLLYTCLSDDERTTWEWKYSQTLLDSYLKYGDEFAAGLRSRLNVTLTEQDMTKYRDKLYAKRDVLSAKQIESVAKEIVFHILPGYLSDHDRKGTEAVYDLCRFVIEEYNIPTKEGREAEQVYPLLKECFLIHTLGEAKEYYIANGCSALRYKDCCLDVDYPEIMDSFEKWEISAYEKKWKQEAIERCFDAADEENDKNIQRILELINAAEDKCSLLNRLKNYIEENMDAIYAKELIRCQIQELLADNPLDSEWKKLLEECCRLLWGFEYRLLNVPEKEWLRKARNEGDCIKEEVYVNKDKKVAIIPREWPNARIFPPRNIYEPRYEWSPTGHEPKIFFIWGEHGLLGELEVAEYYIVWNVAGNDRELLLSLFSECVHELEIIPPDKKVRYATEEEAKNWKEETMDSLIDQDYYFSDFERELLAQDKLDILWIKHIIKLINKRKDYDGIRYNGVRYYGELMDLIFLILPYMEKNADLFCREDIMLIKEYMEKTADMAFEKPEEDITVSDLIACGRKFCRIDTLEKAKKMYLYFGCKKGQRYRNGKYFPYNVLWDEYMQYDISEYEEHWMQEVYDERIKRKKSYSENGNTIITWYLSSCYIFDLLEKIGTFDNFQRFIKAYENYKDKEYILFRTEKIKKEITDKEIQQLLDEFCIRLKKEIDCYN